MKNPKFITFEGCEGSGKSTQSKLLYEYLINRGEEAILTREIGGTRLAEKIRDLIVNEESLCMTELLMVMAARVEHVESVIKPALKQNKWVICDRFIDSTLSYQGSILGVDPVLQLHCDVFGDFMPDLTFFIDLPLEISISRAKNRGDGNKFEEKPYEFHENVYQHFKMLSRQFKERIVTIDGAGAMEEAHKRIVDLLAINHVI